MSPAPQPEIAQFLRTRLTVKAAEFLAVDMKAEAEPDQPYGTLHRSRGDPDNPERPWPNYHRAHIAKNGS
jgi:hypothetical protein